MYIHTYVDVYACVVVAITAQTHMHIGSVGGERGVVVGCVSTPPPN